MTMQTRSTASLATFVLVALLSAYASARTALAYPAFGVNALADCSSCHTTIVDNRAQLLNYKGLIDPAEILGKPDYGALPYYSVPRGGSVNLTIRASNGSEDYAFQFKGTDDAGVSNDAPLVYMVDPTWTEYADPDAPLYSCKSDGDFNGYDWNTTDPTTVSYLISVDPDTTPGYYLLTLAVAGRDPARDGWYQEYKFYLEVTEPTDGLALQATPLIRGQQANLRAIYANPGETVYFVYSALGFGSTNVPQLNVVLDLRNPTLLGQSRANNAGEAVYGQVIPAGTPARDVFIQAAAFGRKSNAMQIAIQ